jgi:DNA-binding FadR family transcriptional regulator
LPEVQERIHSIKRRRLHEDIVQQFHALIRQGALKHGDRLLSNRGTGMLVGANVGG